MNDGELIIRSNRVVFRDHVCPAAIVVRNGAIAEINYQSSDSRRSLDYGNSVVMPGIVDTHVHINEPGRTEWEGFESATMAAAAGGVTTLIEMPLNSIPATTSQEALQRKIDAAQGKLYVDVGFWGGVVPGNGGELANMQAAGAFGFKCFLVPSGVPEFSEVTESDLRRALPELARLDSPLLAHAELQKPIDDAAEATAGQDVHRHGTWLQSRPQAAEDQAIELLIRLADEYKVRVHVVHLSSATAIEKIQKAKRRGMRITVETCPHYLTIAAEDVPDGATEYKCAPPIRERGNQEELWKGLRDGMIDFVVTDHSPARPQMKCRDTGDFMRAWGGIASLQLSLPLMWTAAHERGFALADVAEWLCRRPARFAGLSNKGEIAVGGAADLVVWNPEETFRVDPERLFFRHKLTPYAGRELFGVVQTTFLRGEQIYSAGQFAAGRHGIVLRRTGSSPTSGRLQALNSLHPDEARKTLLNCCGSTAWVEAMSRGRPFADVESLLEAAEQAADLLQDRDWKEAFAAHPRIGEQKITAPEQAKNWSQQEQAGTAGTPAEVQKTLQQLNEEYYSRFGYIFIVCATGKSAEEMLTSLEQRLKNDPAKELKIAAEEQRKITKLRLQKLVSA